MSTKRGQAPKRRKPRPSRVRKPLPPHRGVRPMTSEDALDFIRNMQKAFPKRPRTKADKERLRDYLAQFQEDLLRGVSQRVQGDLMMRPPETVRPKDFEKRRAVPRKPSSRKKPRR